MTAGRTRAIVLAALLAGAATVAVVLASDREDAEVVWAVLGPIVIWSFVGTGLYASRVRPESRTGALMVLLGFAWCVAALSFANPPLAVHVLAGRGRPLGRRVPPAPDDLPVRPDRVRARPRDRARGLPHLHRRRRSLRCCSRGQRELSCDDCPDNLLLVRQRPGSRRRRVRPAVRALRRPVRRRARAAGLRWRRTPPLERLQLTPVYVCGLLTFLLVDRRHRERDDALQWGAFIATALLPIAFLAGLLRSHVARLDAELRARLEELRASRARLVQAGDAERRRLERDLHDGAQSRLVALALMLGQVARRIDGDAERGRAARPARGRAEARASPSCASSLAASTRRC